MIHNLFDEYRFFPKYPDKELHTTALLFGSLVHHQLISNVSLGIALRYVVDALRAGPGDKMFGFATTAIRQFAPDLPQWPQYCAHILQVPGLKEGASYIILIALSGGTDMKLFPAATCGTCHTHSAQDARADPDLPCSSMQVTLSWRSSSRE